MKSCSKGFLNACRIIVISQVRTDLRNSINQNKKGKVCTRLLIRMRTKAACRYAEEWYLLLRNNRTMWTNCNKWQKMSGIRWKILMKIQCKNKVKNSNKIHTVCSHLYKLHLQLLTRTISTPTVLLTKSNKFGHSQ